MDSVNNKVLPTEPQGDWRTEIDDEGRMVLPAQFAHLYGLKPGSKIRLEETMIGLRMRQPVTHLAKVYIEPTNCCNLDCRTCIRNTWDDLRGEDGRQGDSRGREKDGVVINILWQRRRIEEWLRMAK